MSDGEICVRVSGPGPRLYLTAWQGRGPKWQFIYENGHLWPEHVSPPEAKRVSPPEDIFLVVCGLADAISRHAVAGDPMSKSEIALSGHTNYGRIPWVRLRKGD